MTMTEAEVIKLSEIAARLGTELGKVFIPFLARTSGELTTVHTQAIGYACGGLYRAVIGTRVDSEREIELARVAQVLALAFFNGTHEWELAETIARAMDVEFGPRPWDGQKVPQ